MPSRQKLPDRIDAKRGFLRRTGRSLVERIADEYGPIVLGIEHGLAGVAVGLGIWFVIGLFWAIVAGVGTIVGLRTVRRR